MFFYEYIRSKKPKQTIGSITEKFVLIDKLKEQKLLETTAKGVFYTYQEVLAVNKDPRNFLKNLYVYARSTGLLSIGEELQIKQRLPNNEELLLATILADNVTIYDTEKAEV